MGALGGGMRVKWKSGVAGEAPEVGQPGSKSWVSGVTDQVFLGSVAGSLRPSLPSGGAPLADWQAAAGPARWMVRGSDLA